ncbi:hypothetical protein GobsT_22850 [Gemmata obscuriglobus]|uniref:Uncharacterized protein n=1 Tax=Gemmata obscuriglobus TaxID=114 RepID=A0A2Z3H8S1_9BACT|nr:hypothetical protein [Gemmata obscuriglobus]AWM39395.1 hypothetical protein C1280_22015 [Gemmata obscuriglobus]QEG27529.1 hypothetical protein GobsT_22850 [Gemmata obscuriglobus]VTS04577.1 unnamed protein product [Gemmata obscuriglobus UQM 2246]
MSAFALYTNTVTFGGPIATKEFLMASGAISQPTSGTDLTVTDTFTWTGGTLNSASTESTVYLNGAVGTISSAGTLTLGSALVVNNGATLASDASLNFSHGSPVTVDNATMTISAVPMGGIVWSGPAGSYDDGKAKVELKTNGTITIGTNVQFDAKNRTFLNNGGNLNIEDGAFASFGANLAPANPTAPKKIDIVQNSGTITISGANGTLKSKYGSMKVNGGNLVVDVVGANSSTGKVDAQLTIAGGTVKMLGGYGTLKVTKDLYWIGGTFLCGLNVGNQVADKIRADEKFYIGGNVTISIYIPNWNTLPLGVTFTARVLEAGGGFKPVVANEDIDITLALPPGGPGLKLQGSTLVMDGTEVYDLVPA